MQDPTTLQRLLRYPHSAVFDVAPASEIAFLIGHPDGATFEIAERVMVARAGALERTYTLSLYTVNTLAAALQQDGFTVTGVTTTYQQLSALALVEGSGDELVSNGNRVHVYTSLLWVILSAYAAELFGAGEQIVQALRQMLITQAEGEWLDLWGGLYGVQRLGGELDAAYAPRIPQEAFRIRVNARAIELAIRDATGYDVRIEEPWEDIFTLDDSTLSGPDRLYDGETVGYHLIRPVANSLVDWDAVFAVINRNRAAGVLIAGSTQNHTAAVSVGPINVGLAIVSTRVSRALYEDRALLDYSDIEDVSVPNHQLIILRERLQGPAGVALSRTWVSPINGGHGNPLDVVELETWEDPGADWVQSPNGAVSVEITTTHI